MERNVVGDLSIVAYSDFDGLDAVETWWRNWPRDIDLERYERYRPQIYTESHLHMLQAV